MFPIGNNLNRGHIYFQDFWKCSSILNKAKQLQFNRKQKLNQKKGRKKPLVKGRIVFDSSTPPSFQRILNLETRFF